ncbi:MAG: ABC1 kinase family protein [Christensenellaceae bacterium]|jgi:ubiquinone biosynthesis protein
MEQKGKESGNKNMKRYMEILSVLKRNGLGFLFIKTVLSKHPRKVLSRVDTKTIAVSIRKSCEELGPTFVKLGQIMGTRTDLVPAAIAEELKKLQDAVAPFSFIEAKKVIENELSGSIEEIFTDFDEVPVASASISQVYNAFLHSGDRVAVKVQRPHIQESIETDLGVLDQIAGYIDKHSKYGTLYDFPGMVSELRRVMYQEIDFVREGENIDRFREDVLAGTNTTAPKVKWVYTTEKVLTMNFVDGIKIDDTAALDRVGADKKKLAYDFVNSLIVQILAKGFFHADPHPGNVMVVENGSHIEFIDLGMAGSITPRFRNLLTEMVLGIATKNTRKIATAIMQMDVSDAEVNQHQFTRALDRVLDEYLYVPLGEVNIAQVFTSVFGLAAANNMKIPREFTLVAKSLATAQSIVEKLDPESSILSIAEKTVHNVISDSRSVKEVINQAQSTGMDVLEIGKQLPALLLSFMRKAEENDFAVEMKMKGLNKAEKDLERIFNRLSFTVVLLAICIVMAGVIVAVGFRAQDSDALFDLSVFALRFGLIIAAVIVGGLILSIIKSWRSK